jgi:hypothetical protein
MPIAIAGPGYHGNAMGTEAVQFLAFRLRQGADPTGALAAGHAALDKALQLAPDRDLTYVEAARLGLVEAAWATRSGHRARLPYPHSVRPPDARPARSARRATPIAGASCCRRQVATRYRDREQGTRLENGVCSAGSIADRAWAVLPVR